MKTMKHGAGQSGATAGARLRRGARVGAVSMLAAVMVGQPLLPIAARAVEGAGPSATDGPAVRNLALRTPTELIKVALAGTKLTTELRKEQGLAELRVSDADMAKAQMCADAEDWQTGVISGKYDHAQLSSITFVSGENSAWLNSTDGTAVADDWRSEKAAVDAVREFEERHPTEMYQNDQGKWGKRFYKVSDDGTRAPITVEV